MELADFVIEVHIPVPLFPTIGLLPFLGPVAPACSGFGDPDDINNAHDMLLP